ncbi:porin family protein [Sulfurimonas paralvinellae]|uniref:Porin family protein n=1 Tax=Sulfurimonas paralvinellae TaxID=317658 RepID=A0A7M1B9A7_9BACT|nr:porin family protein [Sulfurimonas paralvinellae]QOP46016.1 porin family protein [Sulfurimonas paralvinellae]
MTKQLSALTLASILSASAALANEEVANTNENKETFHHKEEKVYVVAKGLMTNGDTIQEGEASVKGKNGKGFGIDLGYRTGTGVNFEIDYAYTELDVTETTPTEETHATGKYHSFSFDLLYAYHLNEPFAIFAKAGYEYEKEKINTLGVDKSDTGFLYGAGFEYELKENLAFIFEYEDSTIDGPKGYTLAAGLVIGLDVLP